MHKLNIVLFEPEIPFNTANISRTCLATNSKLHLINHNFDLSDKSLNRASANHWKDVDLYEYKNFEDFLLKNNPKNMFFLSKFGKRNMHEFDVNIQNKEVYLIFGSETKGLPKEIMKKYKNNLFRLPMNNKVRSLNLSNIVAICIYESMRQSNYINLK